MNDRDFLMWLHARLTDVHGEDELFDYMHKLRAIIAKIPPEQCSPNMTGYNDLEQLRQGLVQDSAEGKEA